MKKISGSFGGRIRELRGDLTQAECAQLLDIKQAMISRYEADKEMPSPPVLLRLAQFSGRPMEWLLTGQEVTLPPIGLHLRRAYGWGVQSTLSPRDGKRTGRDVTTLSSAAKRLQIRSKTDLKLAERMKELFEAVS